MTALFVRHNDDSLSMIRSSMNCHYRVCGLFQTLIAVFAVGDLSRFDQGYDRIVELLKRRHGIAHSDDEPPDRDVALENLAEVLCED